MPDDEQTPPPKIIAVPSDRLWFDPRVILTACQFTTTDVACLIGNSNLVAVPDPLRVAVGFTPAGIAAGSLFVSPWPDAGAAQFQQITNGVPCWFWLHRYFNLVCAGWYLSTPVAGNLRVTTVRRT